MKTRSALVLFALLQALFFGCSKGGITRKSSVDILPVQPYGTLLVVNVKGSGPIAINSEVEAAFSAQLQKDPNRDIITLACRDGAPLFDEEFEGDQAWMADRKIKLGASPYRYQRFMTDGAFDLWKARLDYIAKWAGKKFTNLLTAEVDDLVHGKTSLASTNNALCEVTPGVGFRLENLANNYAIYSPNDDYYRNIRESLRIAVAVPAGEFVGQGSPLPGQAYILDGHSRFQTNGGAEEDILIFKRVK